MLRTKILWLVLSPGIISAQNADWESLNTGAKKLQAARRYPEAEKVFQSAIAAAEASASTDLHLAASLNGLGALYRNQARYEEAAATYHRALSAWERIRGPEDPNVATILNNLAGVYRKSGRYSECEPLYLRALHLYEKNYFPKPPRLTIVDAHVAPNSLVILQYVGSGDNAPAATDINNGQFTATGVAGRQFRYVVIK